HAVFVPAPAKGRHLRIYFPLAPFHSLTDSPVRCQHRHLMPPPRQSFGKRTHFHRRTAKFEERGVGFRDVQDSHCSRRIFFSDFAKTLKRNSCSTRCLPFAPIS